MKIGHCSFSFEHEYEFERQGNHQNELFGQIGRARFQLRVVENGKSHKKTALFKNVFIPDPYGCPN